jgi:circadian clock protein KaiB
VRAIANANAICAGHPEVGYKLEIVDLLKFPKRALADGVIVTPTLVKLRPLPVQRIVGNLSDMAEVLLALGDR